MLAQNSYNQLKRVTHLGNPIFALLTVRFVAQVLITT